VARVILLPVGSHGDVHPFAAIGQALKRRGHDITMITAEPFRTVAESNGFEFVPMLTDQEYRDLMNHPDLWNPRRCLSVVFDRDLLAKYLPIAHRAVCSRIVPGETVLVGGTMAYVARIIHDQLGTPLVTVHLQPMSCASIADPPVHPTGSDYTWLPRPVIRLGFWAVEKWVTDRMLGPPINDFRSKLGLEPVRRILTRWAPSPRCVLGTFPDWFASLPDMGPAFHHVGFVPYDDAKARPTPPGLLRFMRDGAPPVIFSFGSAMRMGRPYFEAAVDACRRLNIRGVLLAKGGDQIPPSLPEHVFHCDYAPFSEVFPLAATIVHHGGIGTSAQALAAGVPQLIMPLAFDQADNAKRLRRLGVARVRDPKGFSGGNVAADLRIILHDASIKDAAIRVAGKRSDGTELAADRIESQINSEPVRGPYPAFVPTVS
jgi:rhamnosyltransferase subunit B